MSFNKSN